MNTQASHPSESRKSELLLLLKEKGSASIAEMAERFAVSEMTVRRMVHKLADAGLVIRTPGGAMLAPYGSMERSFIERSAKNERAKDAIGRAAAGLVQPGETIVLDSGTTTRYIARHLATTGGVNVITTSLAVLEELAGSPGVEVRLTGGQYRRGSHRSKPSERRQRTCLTKAVGGKRTGIGKRSRARHHFRQQPASDRTEREPMMLMAEVEPQSGVTGRLADDRQHVRQAWP